MPMRRDPNSPIGTVTSSDWTAPVGSRTVRVSWRSSVRFSTCGAPGGSSRSGRAAAGGRGDLGLPPFLHHQHAVAVGDLDRLHDLPLAQDRVDVGLRLALERHCGEQVAAGAFGAAGDAAGQILRLAAGLEQNAVELAARQSLKDQPGEEREIADDEEAEEGEDDPVAPGGGPSGPRKHPRSIAPGARLSANSMKRLPLEDSADLSLIASDFSPPWNIYTNRSVTHSEYEPRPHRVGDPPTKGEEP